jgi:hypothetical protein
MKKIYLLVLAIFILNLLPLGAQVSVGAGDQTDVTVEIDGEKEIFTVLKDYKKPDQFYYIPNRPQLATRGTGSKKRPVFHLLKYQTKDDEINELVEGGVLQFAIKLAPNDETLAQIRKSVARQFKLDEKTIKLSPLPFKTAEVSIYDLEGELLTTEFQKPGIAPSFANNEIPFQVRLTKLSTDVYDALTRGGGGIPVYITYTFDQISPSTGFKVTVDWDQTYSHFSKDEKTKKAYTQWYYYRTWWDARRARAKSGVTESQTQTLSEILQENKSLKVESIAGEDFTPEEINKYMDPIIERVSKELVDKMTPPEKIDPAATKEPGNPGYWRTSTNMAVKDIKKVKKGKETIEFNRRHIFESKSTYGSVLGIGGYDKKVQEELITIMPAGNWDYAYFSVPSVGDGYALDIKKITLQVTPKYYDSNKRLMQIRGTTAELAIWNPDYGYFTDRRGNEVTNILFPLQAITADLEKKNIPLTDCVYEVKIVVTQGRSNLTFDSLEEFIVGGIPVSTPLAMIEGVEIDCDIGLTWGDRSDKQSLAAVQMKVKSEYPNKTYNLTIKGSTENKMPVFLVEKEDEGKTNRVTAVINFILFNGSRVAWKHNGRNLRDDDIGLSVMLWDEDYMKED